MNEREEIVIEVKNDADNIGLIVDVYGYESGTVYATAAREFADTGHVASSDSKPFGTETERVNFEPEQLESLEILIGEYFSGGRYGFEILSNGQTLYEKEYSLDALGIEISDK
jgi:hypothetical protein